MRQRFGPREKRQARYTAAFALTSSMADLLSEDEFAAFLQAALRGDREGQEHDGPVTWSFREYFAHALRDALGEIDRIDGRREAWHIMYAAHCILPGNLLTPFLQCAYDALCSTTNVSEQPALSM